MTIAFKENRSQEIEKLWERAGKDAQLLGRVTYEGFAAAWPTRDGSYADHLNKVPKYVVSTTLHKAEWNNSHLIQANVAQELVKLKQTAGKDILVHGSKTLVQTLIENHLVDEYHLLVYPLLLGNGLKLLDGDTQAKLKLADTKPFGSGVVALIYQAA